MKASIVNRFRSTATIVSLAIIAWCFCSTSSYSELVTLVVDPGTFPSPSSASVLVDAGLLGDDTVTSSISGTLTLDLLPSAVNPSTAQIADLDLQIDDEVDFEVGGFFLFPTVAVTAEAGEIKLNLVEPGQPGTIDRDQFSQFDNLVGLEGEIVASIEPEPFDLSEQEPTVFDFEDVNIDADRRNVELTSELFTQVEIPVDAGPISVDVFVEVEAELSAKGLIPAAEYVWDSTNANPNLTYQFDEPQNWTRGGVADTGSLPIDFDRLLFKAEGEAAETVVDLSSSPTANELEAQSSVEFVNGELTLMGDDVAEALSFADASIVVSETASLNSSNPIVVAGTEFGDLTIDGTATELVMRSGTFRGRGTIERLTVEGDATLSTTVNGTLKIENELSLGGDFNVESFDGTGEFTLVEAGSINASELGTVTSGDVEAEETAEGTFSVHVGLGLFGSVEITDSEIIYRTEQSPLGDADGNGLVQFSDFLALSANFGGAGTWIEGDFDGDGQIGFPDFLLLSESFGTASPSASANVPAPSGNLLCLAGTLLLLSLRSRRK